MGTNVYASKRNGTSPQIRITTEAPEGVVASHSRQRKPIYHPQNKATRPETIAKPPLIPTTETYAEALAEA